MASHNDKDSIIQMHKKLTSDIISIQVGGREFMTTRDTLTHESVYFSVILSEPPQSYGWVKFSEQPQPYYHYIIDSDPGLFADVLSYLRTGVFPLYFDQSTKTFDYAKYIGLLGVARVFRIKNLEEWIQKQGYLEAMKIQHSIDTYEEPQQAAIPKTHKMDEQLDFSFVSRAKRTYLCPRRIPVHNGQPDKCGRQCKNAQGDTDREYEETRELTTIVVKTQYVFNPEACLGVIQSEPAAVSQELDEVAEMFNVD
ncbi:hypothetical protein GGR57DRAFT_455422 [Xylariaceae sp. FL1272]|nr:hypothetical protein GGR57DRAFT_455422 [Xylariaceae sp. FL1272]